MPAIRHRLDPGESLHRLSLERRGHAPRGTLRVGELEHDRRRPREVLQHFRDPLEDLDAALIGERLAEADDEFDGTAGG